MSFHRQNEWNSAQGEGVVSGKPESNQKADDDGYTLHGYLIWW